MSQPHGFEALARRRLRLAGPWESGNIEQLAMLGFVSHDIRVVCDWHHKQLIPLELSR
jgi:hypothetical protein